MSGGKAEKFYRAFENRFRGSRELIKSRLQIYLPIVDPLKQFDSLPAALDLGCGRGEWLEVLTEAGFKAEGVDMDDGMLEAAHAQGLSATRADAIEFLRGTGDETQFVVSGFHIAEHLAFEDLQTLIEESLRVLRPGGFLILETPNSENIRVGASSFYLDPTHERPLPPELLAFLTEYSGFARQKVIRLQETPGLREAQSASLLEVLTQVSPDYAVVAQKAGDDPIMSATLAALEVDRGVSLSDLANKFDAVHSSAIASLENSVATLQEVVASQSAQMVESRAQIENLLREHQAERAAMNDHIVQLLQEIANYRNSTSWRITAPLRAARSILSKRS